LLVAAMVTQTRTVSAQAANAAPMSEQVFKNIQVLKGIPADEFIDTMGMFASALAFDCVSCHSEEIATSATLEAFAIPTPRIQMARTMVVMTNRINQMFFGGRKRVTCFTCHASDSRPDMVPSLALQYGELVEDPYELEFIPAFKAPTADEIFAKHAKAVGGAAAIGNLKTLIARGTYAGYDTGLMEVPVEIFGRAPNQRTIVARGPDGISQWTVDGRSAWRMQPNTPIPVLPLTGGNLAGARTDAMLMFPLAIRSAFDKWQVSLSEIDGKAVEVLQGTKEGELPVTLHFDESGLLVRVIRWNQTAVGPVPTQLDFADYRDVSGIRMPFDWKITWTGGEIKIVLKDIQANAPVDDARFARPVPAR
jgi:hypothetical protein